MKENIENIIAKYFAGESTSVEKTQVEKFKKENPSEYEKYLKAYNENHFESRVFESSGVKEHVLRSINENKTVLPPYYKKYLRYAALFAGLFLLSALYFYFFQKQNISYTNNTGDKLKIELPDGSKLLLDKGASIAYEKTRAGWFSREVTMNGRIFFNIIHNDKKPFKVIEKRVSITDLGTEFTVNVLSNHTQIILSSGKIDVISNNGKQEQIAEKKGEQIIVDNAGNINKNQINPNLYTSWTKKKLFFNNCTVGEVIQLLHDSYDIKVALTDKSALDKKLSGSAPSDNPLLILKAISQIIHKKIVVN